MSNYFLGTCIVVNTKIIPYQQPKYNQCNHQIPIPANATSFACKRSTNQVLYMVIRMSETALPRFFRLHTKLRLIKPKYINTRCRLPTITLFFSDTSINIWFAVTVIRGCRSCRATGTTSATAKCHKPHKPEQLERYSFSRISLMFKTNMQVFDAFFLYSTAP
jgi:hypothetical protein